MTHMNGTRVLMGGVVAGLVINISETLLNMVVLADATAAATAALGGGMTPWAMPFFIAMAFVWGFALVWLYAAVRPRLGPGPRTALIVGGLFWLLVSLLPTMAALAMGITAYSASAIGISLVWTLVELPLASVAGAWLYQEAPETVAAPAHGRPL
jgi:hypothetical protein